MEISWELHRLRLRQAQRDRARHLRRLLRHHRQQQRQQSPPVGLDAALCVFIVVGKDMLRHCVRHSSVGNRAAWRGNKHTENGRHARVFTPVVPRVVAAVV